MLCDLLTEHRRQGTVNVCGSRVPRLRLTDGPHERRVMFTLGLALVLGLAVAGCSGGGDAAPSTSSSSTSPSAPSTTASAPPSSPAAPTTSATGTTTQPSSQSTTDPPTTSTPGPRDPALQELLDRYDAAVTAILADPRVASDPTSTEVRDYLALFAPDSTFAQGALEAWAQEGEQGRFFRPGPTGELVDSTVREVTDATDTFAEFTVCSRNSIEIVDADGNLIESQGGVAFVEVVAVWSGGDWLLRDLTQSSGDCPTPGSDE